MTSIDNTMVNSGDKLASSTSDDVKKALKPKEMSPDDFIKLFLAQLKNQNPEHPVDSSTILQQMSQISSIKSSNEMQKTLENLQKNMDRTFSKSQVLEASQLIGKKVQVQSNVSALVPGEGLVGSVLLPAPASDVVVAIKDANGAIVKTIDCGASTFAGPVDFKWNGLDQDGKPMEPKNYQIVASAMINGKAMMVDTAAPLKVSSVAMNQGTSDVVINVDGMGSTKLENILKIY